MAIQPGKMASDLKEFIDLLLNNLKSLDAKVDVLQKDMSLIKSDVAVLKETKEAVKNLDACLESFQSKLSQLDKEMALKSSKWGVISSLVTMIIALLIAYITGLLES